MVAAYNNYGRYRSNYDFHLELVKSSLSVGITGVENTDHPIAIGCCCVVVFVSVLSNSTKVENTFVGAYDHVRARPNMGSDT